VFRGKKREAGKKTGDFIGLPEVPKKSLQENSDGGVVRWWKERGKKRGEVQERTGVHLLSCIPKEGTSCSERRK